MPTEIIAAIIGALALIVAAFISPIVALLVNNLYENIFVSNLGFPSIKKSIFYNTRDDLPGYKYSISQAKQEICLLSIHAISFIRKEKKLIESKLESGCRLRILSLSEKNELGTENNQIKEFQEYTCHYASILKDIQASNSYTAGWIRNLEKELRDRVKIKTYEYFPTIICLIIDKDSKNGFAIVEPIMPFTKDEDRIRFKLCFKDNPDLFVSLSKSFDALWDKSKEENFDQ